MPIRKCLKCRGIENSTKNVGATPAFWQFHVERGDAKYHAVKLGQELRRTGNCLTVYMAYTFCGLSFELEIDSSD